MEKYTVILLAGDRGPDDPMAGALGVERKALLPILGKPMISYVLETLAKVENVGKVLIVANDCKTLEAHINVEGQDIELVEGRTSPATSLKSVLEEKNEYPVLVLTADCPLLTPEMVNEFIEGTRINTSDVFIGFASEMNIEARYPEGKRTYLKFKGDGYSGCNMFAFASDKVLKILDFWAGIEKSRKKAFVVISAFGFWTLILVFFRLIDIKGAFVRVSKKLNLNISPIILSDPDAAIDVDRPKHVAIVEEILEKRRESQNIKS